MAIRPADQIVHKAAWLYYAHGLRQDQVAQQLNISRASVAMYLRKARETGIVNISTSTQLFTDDVMAREIEDAFGLDAVWIAPHGDHVDPAAEVPVLAAGVFLELVKKGDRIGVAWGQTVYAIADVMSYADLQDVTVVQLCGNLGAPFAYRPDQCTMEIARRLNAKGLNFYAPLVLSTEELAQRAARRAGHPRAARRHFRLRPRALFDRHGRRRQPCRQMRRADGRRDGRAARRRVRPASSPARSSTPRARCSTAATTAASSRPTSLRCAPFRSAWSWCRKTSKFEPLLAGLAGGLCTHLVVNAAMAKRLLDHARASERKAS